jgi:uncharacterized lipoprotein YddW (UPF0748 family)
VVVSSAVFPDADEARTYRFQDWRQWLATPTLDMVCPMAYSTDTDTVKKHIGNVMAVASGRPVWAGIGAWRITPEETAAKIRAARELGAQGFILFSYGGVTDEGKSEQYLDKLDQLLAEP